MTKRGKFNYYLCWRIGTDAQTGTVRKAMCKTNALKWVVKHMAIAAEEARIVELPRYAKTPNDAVLMSIRKVISEGMQR